jgi:hypothetical protein
MSDLNDGDDEVLEFEITDNGVALIEAMFGKPFSEISSEEYRQMRQRVAAMSKQEFEDFKRTRLEAGE